MGSDFGLRTMKQAPLSSMSQGSEKRRGWSLLSPIGENLAPAGGETRSGDKGLPNQLRI
jgi:hypothetical protein